MIRRWLARHNHDLRLGGVAYINGEKYVLIQAQGDGIFLNLRYQAYDEWREDHRLP